MLISKQKHPLTIAGNADFIQDHHNRYRSIKMRHLQRGKEIGFNFRYSMGKKEFVAREQGEGQWMKIH